MEMLLEFIRPELLILVVFLYSLGLFLKLYSGFKQEWAIPFLLLTIGVVFTILYIGLVLGEGFGAAVIVASIIQGVLVSALAVFGNELIKQGIKKRLVDKT